MGTPRVARGEDKHLRAKAYRIVRPVAIDGDGFLDLFTVGRENQLANQRPVIKLDAFVLQQLLECKIRRILRSRWTDAAGIAAKALGATAVRLRQFRDRIRPE